MANLFKFLPDFANTRKKVVESISKVSHGETRLFNPEEYSQEKVFQFLKSKAAGDKIEGSKRIIIVIS